MVNNYGKVAITRENYRQIILKRAIIACWVILIVCFIIKLFGGNFFNIISNNERFIQLCKFIDNTWLYYVVGYINYIFAGYIYTFAIIGKINNYKKSIFNICWIKELL